MIFAVTLRLHVDAGTDVEAMQHIQTALTSIMHPNLNGHLVDILEVTAPKLFVIH